MKNTNKSTEAIWRLIILTAIAMGILISMASCNTRKHLVQHNDVSERAELKRDSTVSRGLTEVIDSIAAYEENRERIKDLELTFEGIITQEDKSGAKQTYDGKLTIKQKEEDSGGIIYAEITETAKTDTNNIQVTQEADRQIEDKTATELTKRTTSEPTIVAIIILTALIIIVIYTRNRWKEVRHP